MADNRFFGHPLPLERGQGRQEVAANGGNVGSHPMLDITTPALKQLQGQLDALTDTLTAEEDFAQTQTALHNMRVLKDEKEAELFDRLNLPDGDEKSFYDNGGNLRSGELKNFINSYAKPMQQLGAAGLTQRSREMVMAQALADADEFSRAVMSAGRERGRKRAMDAADARLKYHRLRGDYEGANAVVADMYEAGIASADDVALLEEQNRMAAEQKAQADAWKGAQELMFNGDMGNLSMAFHNGDFDLLPVSQRSAIRDYLNNATTEGQEVRTRDAQGREKTEVEPPMGLPAPVVNGWMLANSGEQLTTKQQTEVQEALEFFADYTITTPDDPGQQELVRQMGKRLKLSDKYVEAVIKGSVASFGGSDDFKPDVYLESLAPNGMFLAAGESVADFHKDNARMHELRQMKAAAGGQFKSTQSALKGELETLEFMHEFRTLKQRELLARQKAKGLQHLHSLMLGNPEASYVEQQEAFMAGFSDGLTEAQMAAGSTFARMAEQMKLDSAKLEQLRDNEETMRQVNARDAETNAEVTDKERKEMVPTGAARSVQLGLTRDANAIAGSGSEVVLYVPKAEGDMKDGQTITVLRGVGKKVTSASVRVKVMEGISAPLLSNRALLHLGAGGERTGYLLLGGDHAVFMPGESAPPTQDDGVDAQGAAELEEYEEAVPMSEAGIVAGTGADPLAYHNAPLPL